MISHYYSNPRDILCDKRSQTILLGSNWGFELLFFSQNWIKGGSQIQKDEPVTIMDAPAYTPPVIGLCIARSDALIEGHL